MAVSDGALPVSSEESEGFSVWTDFDVTSGQVEACTVASSAAE